MYVIFNANQYRNSNFRWNANNLPSFTQKSRVIFFFFKYISKVKALKIMKQKRVKWKRK